jgi:class 3 adenylate cyclase
LDRQTLTKSNTEPKGFPGWPRGARLDAEKWRDLVGAYSRRRFDAGHRYGRQGRQEIGRRPDGVVRHSVAQENDAERAVRAELAIQRALAELNRKNAGAGKPELVARIGLETGPVVVDATGQVYGDVPNTAARVQALAEPSAVLITAQVQRQAAGLSSSKNVAAIN